MVNQEPRTKDRQTKPAVASYVSDFLKPDMLHIHRQITGLQAVTPWVLTHKRENAAQFPFPEKRLIVLPKPRMRWWRRFIAKQIKAGAVAAFSLGIAACAARTDTGGGEGAARLFRP